MSSVFFSLFILAASSKIEHAKVFGNTPKLGYYYIDLWVGTPPMKQTVIIDTGSRLTAFPCIGCTDCGHHMDQYFDYLNSSTSHVLSCNDGVKCGECKNDTCWYYQHYTEGSSISGMLVEDYIIFGDDFETSKRELSIFGCHRRETHLFRTQQADGIMGLGSKGEIPTLVDVLFNDKEIDTNVFSICLAQEDGFMTVGGYNSSHHEEEVKWANLHGGQFYSIQATGLLVGGVDTGITQPDFTTFFQTGTIIDSGTSFTYMCSVVYQALFKFIEKFCENPQKCLGARVSIAGEPHICYVYNKTERNISEFYESFPDILLVVDGQNITWKPKRFLFAWPESPNAYCVGVYSNGGAGNVLGGNFMRGMEVIFDRTEQKAGFAMSECDPSFVGYNTTFNNTEEHKKIPPPPEKIEASSSVLAWIIIGSAAFIVITGICLLILARRKQSILKYEQRIIELV